jgi:type 1 fimbriae regulatory protein FimB
MPRPSPEHRNVASDASLASLAPTDQHERLLRDFLTPAEMDLLVKAARKGRHGERNHALVLLTYRHGYRASEVVGLRRDDLDFDRGRIWVRRLKNGLNTAQQLEGDEIRALKRYLASRSDRLPWVFVNERGQPMTRAAVYYIVKQAAKRAGLGHVWSHRIRHSTGYALADNGVDVRRIQDALGHRNIQHTVRYTRIAGRHLDGLWGRK